MAKAKRAIPEGLRTITPSLVCSPASEAIAWYKKALGAEELMRAPGPEGKIMHAEIKVGDSVLFLSDAMMQNKDPKALGGTPVSLVVYVEDCDALFNRAVGAGARVTMPIADMFWGDRWGGIADPYGHQWGIATHKEDLTPAELAQRQEQFFKQMAGKPQ